MLIYFGNLLKIIVDPKLGRNLHVEECCVRGPLECMLSVCYKIFLFSANATYSHRHKSIKIENIIKILTANKTSIVVYY